MADMYNKERDRQHVKLTEEQVEEIRQRYVPRKVSSYKLAKEYGVSASHITQITRMEQRTKR